MAKCKNCTRLYRNYDEESDMFGAKWCDKIFDSPDVEIERDCVYYKCMTNADRIRGMSDEELTDYIFGVSIGNAPCVLCSDECDFCELSDEQCKEKTLKWLQSEAE